MNKLFAIAVLALSPLFAVAAQPESVMSESVTDGHTVRTRSLNDRGVLTESTCTVSVDAGAALQHCVSRSTKLSPKQQVALARDMHSAQQEMMASYYAERSALKSYSESVGRQAAAGVAQGIGSSAARSAAASIGASYDVGHARSISASQTLQQEQGAALDNLKN